MDLAGVARDVEEIADVLDNGGLAKLGSTQLTASPCRSIFTLTTASPPLGEEAGDPPSRKRSVLERWHI